MKTIFFTVSITMAVMAFAFSLFMNTILGMFGMAATSVGTLQQLKASQTIVEKMKTRHHQKRRKLTKRLAKRSSKRIASAALSAATIGTVAVAVTMTSLEVADYCEDKEQLWEDENILNGTKIEFDMGKCLEEAKEESKVILKELKDSSTAAVSKAFDGTVEFSAEKWAAIKEIGLKGFQSTGNAAVTAWDMAKSLIVQ